MAFRSVNRLSFLAGLRQRPFVGPAQRDSNLRRLVAFRFFSGRVVAWWTSASLGAERLCRSTRLHVTCRREHGRTKVAHQYRRFSYRLRSLQRHAARRILSAWSRLVIAWANGSASPAFSGRALGPVSRRDLFYGRSRSAVGH